MRSDLRPAQVGHRRGEPFRRRRLIALAALVTVVIVVVWLIAGSGGSGGSGHRTGAAGSSSSTTTGSRQTRAAQRSLASTSLPLAGIPIGRWVTLPYAPSPRVEVAAARLGDEVYVVGGFDPAGHTTAEVQRLNLRSGRWSEVSPLPEALNHMNAVGYRGLLYVVGGYASPTDTSTGAVSGFWRYDPATRRWSTMPSAPVPRAAAGAAVLGHRLYVVGGRNDASTALSSLATFDFDTARWSLGPSLRYPREHLAAVAAGGAVWALGGRVLGVANSDVERYQPGAVAWEPMASMPVARSGFEAVAVGDSIVVAGGEDGSQTVPEVDRLDLRTGRWGALADLPVARHGLGVIADGPLVFTIDGGPAAGLTFSRVVARLRVQ